MPNVLPLGPIARSNCMMPKPSGSMRRTFPSNFNFSAMIKIYNPCFPVTLGHILHCQGNLSKAGRQIVVAERLERKAAYRDLSALVGRQGGTKPAGRTPICMAALIAGGNRRRKRRIFPI
jgi:hypothetical protein